METEQKIKICYTNYRGETNIREIIPQKIWFGSTERHPENGWLLDAFDIEKNADRSFALKDIRAWLDR
ncbi:hypothetical protein AGMMS50268_40550 [Spirochaetia bacterium]|nr:hypothetical protein AGMMS50268_40550 [Spirochaetia bacterium]